LAKLYESCYLSRETISRSIINIRKVASLIYIIIIIYLILCGNLLWAHMQIYLLYLLFSLVVEYNVRYYYKIYWKINEHNIFCKKMSIIFISYNTTKNLFITYGFSWIFGILRKFSCEQSASTFAVINTRRKFPWKYVFGLVKHILSFGVNCCHDPLKNWTRLP
jgi:hypothetical protein